MNNGSDQLARRNAEENDATNQEQETTNDENFQTFSPFNAEASQNDLPNEDVFTKAKEENVANIYPKNVVNQERYRKMRFFDYCMGYSDNLPDDKEAIDFDADVEANQSGKYPRTNLFFSGYLDIDILKFDFALKLLKNPRNMAQDVGPHFFVVTQIKHDPFENSYKRIFVDVPEFHTDDLKRRILEKEEAAEILPSLKVRKLASNVSMPHWKSGDTFPLGKHPSYKNNLAVMYKGYFISIALKGPATILVSKPEYGYSKEKILQTPDFFRRRKIEPYGLIEDEYLFSRYSRGLPWAPHSKALTLINYMKICQLFGKAKLFICMGSPNFKTSPEDLYAAQKNGSCFHSNGCMVFDLEALINDAFSASDNTIKKKANSRKLEATVASLETAEYPTESEYVHPEDFQPDIIFETTDSVWSCDTYSDEDFDVVVLGTNEHMVRVYYASTALTQTGKFCKKFYKSFAIPIYHNVPTLQLSKTLLPTGNLLLTVGAVDGSVYTIELDINDEKQYVQDFLSKLKSAGGSKTDVLNAFLIRSAVCKGKYTLLDMQNLRNPVWTITPLDGKTDFVHADSWKSLTNSELPQFHAEKELACIQTEYLLGRGIDPQILDSQNYNVGALLTTIAVPTMALSSKFWCNKSGGSEYAKDVFNEMIQFETAHQNISPNEAKLPSMIFARNDLGPRLITVSGYEMYLEDCYNDYLVDDIEENERSEIKTVPCPQSLRAVENKYSSKLNKPQEVDKSIITDSTSPKEKRPFLQANTLHNAYFLPTFRRWPEEIDGFSQDDMMNLQKFFHAADGLLGSQTFILVKDYFLEVFLHVIQDTPLFSIVESFLNSVKSVDILNFDKLKELLFVFKRFEDEYLHKDPMTWVEKILEKARILKTPPLTLEFITKDVPRTIAEEKDLFVECQRSKLGRLYGYELTSLESMETKLANNTYFLVTTESAIYLLYGHPLLVKAYTPESIFPLAHKTFTDHDTLQHSNRLSIVVHIKELCAVAVASQIGLVSIMRLVEYKGVKSFRQECILGLEFLTKFDETVEPYADNLNYSNLPVRVRGSDHELQSKGTNVAFPMATIIGMTYEMLSESVCMVYIYSEVGSFQYELRL